MGSVNPESLDSESSLLLAAVFAHLREHPDEEEDEEEDDRKKEDDDDDEDDDEGDGYSE